MTALPLILDGSRFTAVVAGGGAVALRKVRSLLDGGVHVTVIAPAVCPELRDLAAANPRVVLSIGTYDAALIADSTIIVAATNDREVNRRIAADAARLGRLFNVVDDPAAGNFVTPAVHRAGDLTVAVSTGRLPGAAAVVRDAIAARFDDRYAAAIAELRDLRTRLVADGETDAWKTIAAEVLGDDFCARVESGSVVNRQGAWR